MYCVYGFFSLLLFFCPLKDLAVCPDSSDRPLCPILTSLHPHILTSSHPHTLTSSRPPVLTSSRPHIFMSSHPDILTSFSCYLTAELGLSLLLWFRLALNSDGPDSASYMVHLGCEVLLRPVLSSLIHCFLDFLSPRMYGSQVSYTSLPRVPFSHLKIVKSQQCKLW